MEISLFENIAVVTSCERCENVPSRGANQYTNVFFVVTFSNERDCVCSGWNIQGYNFACYVGQLRGNGRSGTDTEMLICNLINYLLHAEHAGSTAFLYANYLKVSLQNSMKLILFSVYKALNQ